MATTVYLPPDLLGSVDKRARAQKVSRNRYITQALRAQLAAEDDRRGWPPGFFDGLKERSRDAGHVDAVAELQRAIDTKKKSRKKALRL